MKFILLSIAILFTSNAFAQDFSKEKMLETLIHATQDVTVLSKDDEDIKLPLAIVFMEQLLGSNHLLAEEGDRVAITGTTMECEIPEGASAAGSTYIECALLLADGDYIKTDDGFSGPSAESAVIIEFTIQYVNSEDTYSVLNNEAFILF